MKKLTLQQIKALPIVGNYFDDKWIFEAVEDFVLDDSNNRQDKAEALLWLDQAVMGMLESRLLRQQELDEVIAELREFREERP